ncbi:MAG: hypothetical protein JXA24_07750 [Proteobacteria bacterium]|nr:hypothetical protein [Pseudomonadota bacterium]
MHLIIMALVLVLVAGFINGSFAAPMKYMVRWEEENTWFAFSFWGFLILPWLSILVMGHDVIAVVKALPPNVLVAMIAGGIAFGLGQIAFALSFRYVGIGLAFVINISMGTAGSALIPILWHKGVMGTPYSYAQLIGIAIFILAVLLGTAAGAARDRNKAGAQEAEGRTKKIEPGKLVLGVVLAIIAGAGSVAQGVSYIWANPSVSKIAVDEFGQGKLASGVIAWVVIFSSAWIPYVIYFLALNVKRRSFSKLALPGTGKYWLLAVLMGVGFWGSLIFFSKASQEIGGDLAPTIAWPLFMVFIILTSNLWSWKSGEWKGAGRSAGIRMLASLALFVAAIAVFSYSGTLQPENPKVPGDHYHDIHHTFIKHDRYPTHADSGVEEPEAETGEEAPR